MEKKLLFGWASNVINALIFILLILNTSKECFSKTNLIVSAFGLSVSIIAQIYSSIKED